jgi:hypothetical protein
MDLKRGQREPPPSRPANSSTGIRRRPRRFLRSDAVWLARSGLLSWVLLVAGVAAGVMAIVAEFSTISYVTVVTATCEDLADPRLADRCQLDGSERHSYALALLGGFAILMAWGATVGRSRPAAAALVIVGLVLLGIGLFSDWPEAGRTGLIGEAYEATAHRGTGLWLELASGALMVVVGVVAFLKLLRPPADASESSSDAAREPAAA